MKNYYQVLGIDRAAGQEEIKRAFRRMASLYHPDHNPQAPKEAEEKFKEMNQAYEVLSDEARRRQYDRLILIQQRRPQRREVTMKEFLNWGFTGTDILEELLREFAARSIIFDEISRSRPWGCGRRRDRRCRRFYSEDGT
jgi:DnaJ-class molecular chaperone